MVLKLSDIVSGTTLLRKIFYIEYNIEEKKIVERPYSFKMKYKLSKLLDIFEKEFQTYEKFRIAAIHKYGTKTEKDGKAILEIAEDSENGFKFIDEMNALLREPVPNFSYTKFTEDEINDISAVDPSPVLNKFEIALFDALFLSIPTIEEAIEPTVQVVE